MLQGTCIVKLENVIKSIKEIAGTCYLTRAEYDNNEKKICSFSHIDKNFVVTWNELLAQAKIPIKRRFRFPIKQGRKPKNKEKYKEVSCLRCDSLFVSPDPSNFRICPSCKNMIELEE